MLQTTQREDKVYRVIEVARMLGVSKVTIYKKMRYLKDEIKPYVVKEKNITHIKSEGVELIKNTLQVQDFDAENKDSLKVVDLEKQVNALRVELDSKNDIVDKLKKQRADELNDKVEHLRQVFVEKKIIERKLNQQLMMNKSITDELKQQIALFNEINRLSF